MQVLLTALELSRTGEVSHYTLLRLARRMLLHAQCWAHDADALNTLARLDEELHQEYLE
jgi:hypothetical protein